MKSELKIFNLVILQIVLFVLFGVYFMVSPEFHVGWLFFVGLLPVISYLLVTVSKMLSGEKFAWFGIFNLFSFSFLIVHFQFPLLAFFHEDIVVNRRIWNFPDVSTKAVTVGAIGFTIFLIAYVFRLGIISEKERRRRQVQFGPIELNKVFYILFFGSMGAFGVFLSLAGSTYLSGAYAGSANWEFGASYMFMAFEILFNLSIILEIYRMRMQDSRRGLFAYLLGFNPLLSIFVAAYLLFQIYIGDRGPVLTTAIIVLGGYDFYFNRLGVKFFVPFVLSGAIVMTLISQYRTRDATMTLEERVEKAKGRVEGKPYYEYTADLAGNVRTLNATVAVVPETYGYFRGIIQAGGIFGVVPLYQKVFSPSVNGWRIGTTSSFFNTMVINGLYSSIGAGTTIVADCYLDAGIFSVVFLMFILGYFMSWLETTARPNQSIYRMVLFLLVLSYAFYWPRSSLLGGMDIWLWTLGLVWFLRTKVFRRMSFWKQRPQVQLAG